MPEPRPVGGTEGGVGVDGEPPVEPTVRERTGGDATEVDPPAPEPRDKSRETRGEESDAGPEEPEAEPGTGNRQPETEGREPAAAEAAETWNDELEAASPQTVRELLDQWVEAYRDDETPAEEKSKLAYRIVQMRAGLRLARLRAEDVNIAQAKSGILGFYAPATREIAVTPDALELPAEHYCDVLVHEAAHAGKITGRRILDEGLAQRLTERRVSDHLHGIYPSEQQKAEAAFGTDAELADALDKYDFDHPEKLVEPFLEETWKERWPKLAREVAKRPLAHSERERSRLFERVFADENGDATKLTRLLEKGAPELFEKFGGTFKVLAVQKEAFAELYKDWAKEHKVAEVA